MATLFHRISILSKRLWFHSTLYAVGGIVTAIAALAFKDYLPDRFARKAAAMRWETS